MKKSAQDIQSGAAAPAARAKKKKKTDAPRAQASRVPDTANRPGRMLAEHATQSETRSIQLTFISRDAREVFVAGTFNNWQPGVTPMKKGDDGAWVAELTLNPGRYEYRFIVDGCWLDDPMAPRFVPNGFGGTNSVLEVQPFV